MDPGQFEVAGLVLRAPVTVGTNLILAATCAGWYTRITRVSDLRTRMWLRFFLALAVATLAGAPKHGLAHYAGSSWFWTVTMVSSLSAGLSTYYAQRATLESDLFTAHGRVRLLWFVRLQLLAFAAQLFYLSAFSVVVVQAGLGLGGVLIAELFARLRGHVDNWWTVAGIAAALLSGVPYLARWPSTLWFDHVDFAHVLLLVSLAVIFRGAQAGARPEVFP